MGIEDNLPVIVALRPQLRTIASAPKTARIAMQDAAPTAFPRSIFVKLEDTSVLLRAKNGTFLHCDLYQYRNMIYAKVGARYVRLHSNGYTSSPQFGYTELDIGGFEFHRNSLGQLALGRDTTFMPSRRVKALA